MNIYLCTKRNVPIHLTFHTKQPKRRRQRPADYKPTGTHSPTSPTPARLTKMFLPKVEYEPGPASRIRPGYTYVVRGRDGNPQFRKSTGRYVRFEDDEDDYCPEQGQHGHPYPNQLVPPPTPYDHPYLHHLSSPSRPHNRGKTRLEKLYSKLAELQGNASPRHRRQSSHSRRSCNDSRCGSPGSSRCSVSSSSSASSAASGSSSSSSSSSSRSASTSGASSDASDSCYQPPRHRQQWPQAYPRYQYAVPMMSGGLGYGGDDCVQGYLGGRGWVGMPPGIRGWGRGGGRNRGRGIRNMWDAGVGGCWDEMPTYDECRGKGVVRRPKILRSIMVDGRWLKVVTR